MELKTLFKRESVAELILKTCTDSPLPFKNNGGAHFVPGCGDLEFWRSGEPVPENLSVSGWRSDNFSEKNALTKIVKKHCFSSIQQLNSTRIR